MALPTTLYEPTQMSDTVTATKVDGGYIFETRGQSSVFLTDAQALGSSFSGWGNYADTTYTTGSPFSLTTAAGKVNLPNDKGSTLETQKPSDVTTFYNGTVITGRNGDGINVTMEFKVRPTTGATNPRITVSIDIGGAIGELYPRDFILSKGNGIEHYFLSSFDAYTLDTWEANGGTVKVEATGSNLEIYDIRYIITRTHKAV